MDFQALIHNQLFIYGGASFLLMGVGIVWGTKKRKALGRFLSVKLNALLGKKATEQIEQIAQDILDGAKEDNGQK